MTISIFKFSALSEQILYFRTGLSQIQILLIIQEL